MLISVVVIIFGGTMTGACSPNSATTTTTVPSLEPPASTSLPLPANSQNEFSSEEQLIDCNEDSNCNEISESERDDSTKPIPSYQHVIVSALPFQRGRSHGRQAKEKIARLIAHYKQSPLMPPWIDCLTFVRNNYLKAIEYYYPSGLLEMKGIAEGAGVLLEDIVILNAKYELIRWRGSNVANREPRRQFSNHLAECASKKNPVDMSTTSSHEQRDNPIAIDEGTGAVALSSATKYAHVLLGQNWDSSYATASHDAAISLEVYPHPCEAKKPFVMLTEAGLLGRNGMNADGMGVVGMSLQSSDEIHQRTNPRGWVPSILLARMFLEAPTFASGLQAILRTPKHVSVNILVATAEDEALNLELSPKEHFIMQVPFEKEFLAHSNHFKSEAFSARDDIKDGYMGSSSYFRDRRVGRHLHNAWPRINENAFQKAFRDGVSNPDAVCGHSTNKNLTRVAAFHGKATVASVIFNLSQRTLQLSKGPRCKGMFKKYRFKFSEL